MSTLANNKRSCSKKEKKSAQKLRFSCFSGENFGTILLRRSRLSRTSRASSRLSRPRLLDCDAGHDRQMKVSRFLANYSFEHRQQKKFFFRARHLVVIYTPEAHSRIFVTGGSEFA